VSAFVRLDQIAQVSLGFKSLQNDFYYVDQTTIDFYKIEQRFLSPVTLIKEIDGKSFLQDPEISTWIFTCRDAERDLRGTGALKYIHAMADRPAAEKKQQSKEVKTIRDVLSEQGAGLWYSPKAKPHAAHLWLRKGFDAIYAPFVFKAATVVDQRCNYLEPIDGISWQLLGAAISSTIFSFSLEINGSASMGAGVLEAPTRKLRDYPIFDLRTVSKTEAKELSSLANDLWEHEKPLNWGTKDYAVGPRQQKLDAKFLQLSHSGLELTQIYRDLRDACAARLAVAADKVRTKKKQKTQNVATVAAGIAGALLPQLRARQFPESFCSTDAAMLDFDLPRAALRKVSLIPFFEEMEVQVEGAGGRVFLKQTFPVSVAEVFVRALLMGREKYSIPKDSENCDALLRNFTAWFGQIHDEIENAITQSAIGTGYEDIVRVEVYERLGIHPLAGKSPLPAEFHFTPSKA
jgi:hypothetical protein